jgi:hypothetical protein
VLLRRLALRRGRRGSRGRAVSALDGTCDRRATQRKGREQGNAHRGFLDPVAHGTPFDRLREHETTPPSGAPGKDL